MKGKLIKQKSIRIWPIYVHVKVYKKVLASLWGKTKTQEVFKLQSWHDLKICLYKHGLHFRVCKINTAEILNCDLQFVNRHVWTNSSIDFVIVVFNIWKQFAQSINSVCLVYTQCLSAVVLCWSIFYSALFYSNLLNEYM